MSNEMGESRNRKKKLVSFLMVFFVLSVGIGIGTIISYRVDAGGPGDSRLKIQTDSRLPSGNAALALSLAFEEVSRTLEPTVVNINTEEVVRISRRAPGSGDPMEDLFDRFFQMPNAPQQFTRRSLGSGVIVDPKGYIITNSHVVESATKIKVSTHSGEEYLARIIAADNLSDIAVIKIEGNRQFPYARVGDSKAMKVGDWVIAIGSPFGLEQTVTAGIISATGRVFPDAISAEMRSTLFNDYLQTDAAINPGNSGGPLVNMKGEVVGINSFISTATRSSAGVGFAVPSHIFVNVYNQIIDKGKVSRGWLGVNMNTLPFTPAMASYFGVKQGGGVLITGLSAEDGSPSDTAGPAAKAGIKPEDVIVEFGGKKILSVQDLRLAVANTPPGQKAKVKVVRFSDEKVFEVTVAERMLENPAEQGTFSFEETPEPKQEIGLRFDNVPRDVLQEINLQGGALVLSVQPGSLAEDAGLQGQDRGGYDIIVLVNGRKIMNAQDLLDLVKNLRSGEHAVTKFLRVVRGANRRIDTLTYYTSFAKP